MPHQPEEPTRRLVPLVPPGVPLPAASARQGSRKATIVDVMASPAAGPWRSIGAWSQADSRDLRPSPFRHGDIGFDAVDDRLTAIGAPLEHVSQHIAWPHG